MPNQFTDVAEVYDSLMSVVPYKLWLRYVQGLWDEHHYHPRRVLDLACGTGNVTRELRDAGYQVEGADISSAMVRVAARKLGTETRLWCQDARELNLPGPQFDACVCLFDSLNYLTEPGDLERAFRAVRRHLPAGAPFIFDMNAILALEQGMFNQQGTGADDSLVFDWRSRWDPETRLCTIQMEFRRHDESGTQVFHETHHQRGYTLDEVRASLTAGGFRVLAFYDAFTFRDTGPRTDRFYCVAEAE